MEYTFRLKQVITRTIWLRSGSIELIIYRGSALTRSEMMVPPANYDQIPGG